MSRVKGDRPLYSNAAIFSPEGDSANSKISTGQGPLVLLPPTRQRMQAPHSLAAAFLGWAMQRRQEQMDWRRAGEARASSHSPSDEGPALSTATDFKAESGHLLNT